MNDRDNTPRLRAHLLADAVLLGLLLALPGCKSAPKTDNAPLEQAGMYFDGVQQLHALNLSQGPSLAAIFTPFWPRSPPNDWRRQHDRNTSP